MNWHVYPRDRGTWGIRKQGSGRTIGFMTNRGWAIDQAIHQAKKTNGVVYVHDSDGFVVRRIEKARNAPRTHQAV